VRLLTPVFGIGGQGSSLLLGIGSGKSEAGAQKGALGRGPPEISAIRSVEPAPCGSLSSRKKPWVARWRTSGEPFSRNHALSRPSGLFV